MNESSNNIFLWDGKNDPIGATVLSLFDGISCGQQALKELGIPVKEYYASEISKYAIQVTQANHPNTIQIGDVTKVNGTDLPRVDLLIGGSPCQDLTKTKKDRKNLTGDSSKLFWEYVRLIKECKPKYFLLENVEMDSESENMVTKTLGVEPVRINSGKNTAQNRPRMYWFNWNYETIETKQCVLNDILEDRVSDKYYLNDLQRSKLNLDYKWSKSSSGIIRHLGGGRQQDRIYRSDGKMACLLAGSKGSSPHLTKTYINGELRRLTPLEYERLQTLPDNYTNVISDMHRYECIGNGWTVTVIKHIFNCLIRQLVEKKLLLRANSSNLN